MFGNKSSLTVVPEAEPDNRSMEELLGELCRYGRVILGQYGSGNDGTWHCSVTLFVTAEGANFQVKTDHNVPTAKKAVRTCLDLTIKCIKEAEKLR